MEREYEFEVSGDATIRGSVTLPDEVCWPAPSVVFCHGFKGFKDWGPWPWLTRQLAGRGFVVHRINFSHCGVGPQGDRHDEPHKFAINSYGRELDDLHHVIDRLRETPVPPGATTGKLGLVGHSRGGMVSVLCASERPEIDAVVTLASPGFSDRFSDQIKADWRNRGHLEVVNQRTGEILNLDVAVLDDYESNRSRYDVAAAVQRRKVPTLVIHGEGDESVPVEEAHILTGVMDPEYRDLFLIGDAGHTFDAAHPFDVTNIPGAVEQLLERTALWFERHLA